MKTKRVFLSGAPSLDFSHGSASGSRPRSRQRRGNPSAPQRTQGFDTSILSSQVGSPPVASCPKTETVCKRVVCGSCEKLKGEVIFVCGECIVLMQLVTKIAPFHADVACASCGAKPLLCYGVYT